MAYRRRSLALALIAIGFAAQWIPWARIDRAAFQYHYYTALPFVVLALAYFVAELWHGASRRTWLVAARRRRRWPSSGRLLMWLLSRPLCGFVGVESVNPGSQACPAVIPELVLTDPDAWACSWSSCVGAVVLVRAVLALAPRRRAAEGVDPARAAARAHPAGGRRRHRLRRRGAPARHADR